ncbi:MAG: PaaI family thioesterase [Anaerolineales bacterium]|nr:PaaI family thioesterase [Anaerolineales bacterium]
MSAITESDGAPLGHERCLFCGGKNLYSLGLSFQADPEKGVRARFRPHTGFQGYAGVLHGGAVAGVLDAAMTHCLFHSAVKAMTADLHVRYVKPLPCGMEYDVRAWILSSAPPLYRLRAEISNGREVLAWAEGKFLKKEHTANPSPGLDGLDPSGTPEGKPNLSGGRSTEDSHANA